MELKTINGWKIWVNPEGTFLADKEGEEQIQDTTLEAIKQEIERLRKSSAQRIPFWEVNNGFGFHDKEEGEITSLKQKEGSYRNSYDAWYSKKRKESRNERGHWYSLPIELIKPNEVNQKIMEEYIEIKKKKEALETKMTKKREEFEVYTKKEIVENFGFDYQKD